MSVTGLESLAYGNFRNVCPALSVGQPLRTANKWANLPKSWSSSRARSRSANAKTLALLCLCGGIQAARAPWPRPSEAFAGRLLGHRELRGRAMPRHVLRYSKQGSAGCERGSWRAEEDWAILDETPAFTVGSAANTVTFWSALATASSVLCHRTALELEQRRASLAADKSLSTGSFGREPSVLSSWEQLPDGRFTGTVDGRTVWLTVELEGRLASDPRAGAGYLISLGGRVYELGESGGRLKEPGMSTMLPGGKDERVDQDDLQSVGASVTGWLPFLGTALLAGGVGLFIGVSDVVPHKMVPRVTMASVSSKTQPPPAVPLVLSEQRSRLSIVIDKQKAEIAKQELKLQTDQDPGNIKAKVAAEEARLQTSLEKAKKANQDRIEKMESRLKEDVERQKGKLTAARLKLRQSEELALELQRVETERGANAAAVQMSVPKSSERFQ